MKQRKPTMTKITVKFYAPMFRQFEAAIARVMLLRDNYIDHMISAELEHVEEDLKGKRNSEVARRHIASALKRMGGAEAGVCVTASIKIRKSTAASLRKVVKKHNLCRDALLNRLLAYLHGYPEWMADMLLATRLSDIPSQAGVQDMPASPLEAIEESLVDPLYYLRADCHHHQDVGLYEAGAQPKWHGFACYLDDAAVPGTKAYVKQMQDAGSDEPF